MRNFLPALFLLSILFPNSSFGQFNNWDFEEWEIVDGEEVPVGWHTNQDSTRLRIMKTDFSYEGDYAMQMIANAPGLFQGCYASAATGVKLEQPSSDQDSLSFAFKIAASPGSPSVFFLAKIWRFVDGQRQAPILWTQHEKVNAFKRISLPLEMNGIDSLEIEFFTGGLANGVDECIHKSQAWIDDVQYVSGLTSSISENKLDFNVYPNPSTGIINITNDEKSELNYELYNMNGQLLERGTTINKINLRNKGLHYLRIHDQNGSAIEKVVIK